MPPIGDMACAASPIASSPGRYQRVSRSSLTRQQMQVGDLVELARGRARGAAAATSSRIASMPARLIFLGRALRDHEGALPIIAAVDHHEQPPALDIAAQAAAVSLGSWRRGTRTRPSARRGPRAEASVADDRARPSAAIVSRARSSRPSRSRTPATLPCSSMKPVDRRLHLEVKAGKRLRLLAQEIEEVPLRHHRDERRRRIEVRQVADRPFAPGEPQLGAVDLVVRPLQEALEHPELVEDLHRRRVDRVAAEIAEEVGVLFEHPHVAAGAREQQAGHHPAGPAADDDQVASI